MDRVTIFGRSNCGFCRRAKELCEIKELNFLYVDIVEEGISKADMAKTIGHEVETVPQIFVGKKHIGGFDEFNAFMEAREAETAE
ncbi:glutaredoxin 1 [Tamilnaduibacter salinus]|uniref:Glutaredoxin 1 n=1 Tax=Tamilnaduibacter salinus TaxID=1484056 RepID=A0A2A2I6C4_9GAMM|nr:GrxA family glutaredoxin [Tamilnaduibacter salinus]PAV27289.1 GrxA family glutaredoxin [Tamilnaduibacter salinus]PVY78872.1 glutaredoxin 1 [Tamilnaduibacter salinus]